MSWQTHIRTADSSSTLPPALDIVGQSSPTMLVGPAMHGGMYRSAVGTPWYRAIPIDQTDLEWRHRCHAQRTASSYVILPQRDWQQQFAGRAWLILEYDPGVAARSLSQIFAESPAAERLAAVINVFRTAENWWSQLPPPLFPMPSDVVLAEDGRPIWLGIIGGLPLRPPMLQAAPRRMFAVPPEWLASGSATKWDPQSLQAIDRYALGVIGLESLFQLSATIALDVIAARAVSGNLYNSLPRRGDVPFWMPQFPRYERAVAALRQLVGRNKGQRLDLKLTELAGLLESLLELADAGLAAAWLRDRARPREALKLLEELFPHALWSRLPPQKQYWLLCMAADLNARFLGHPLDALDYYERAIQLDPVSLHAHREELQIIARARHQPTLEFLVQHNTDIAEDVDQKLWRSYRAVCGNRKTHAMDKEDARLDRQVADYLNWRGQHDRAQQFILSRLYDANGTYMWRDFDLSISYARSLVGMDVGDGANLLRAREQLEQIKRGLQQVGKDSIANPELVHELGGAVTQLEMLVASRLSQIGPAHFATRQPG